MTGRHTEHYDDMESKVTELAYACFAQVLAIQTGAGLSREAQRMADITARLSSRTQRHSAGLCTCPPPPVLGGTHS